MITHVTHVTVLVHDQDNALQFYTEQLGFEKRSDDVFGAGLRWLTVAPPGQTEVELVLVKADTDQKRALVGHQAADHVFFVVITDDCYTTYDLLHARGVHFRSAPTVQPWGVEAMFEDLYGNVFDLVAPHGA